MAEVKSRVQPSVQPPDVRRSNFDEVVLGYTPDEAAAEAQRCILCKNPRCQTACPLHNQIPRWIAELKQGRVEEASRIIRETSPMPELCSRLCPQERLCEGACALGIKHEAVAIGLLERYVSDRVQPNGNGRTPVHTQPHGTKKRVAAAGSGPASLAFAQRMAREGHEVTVFERWPRLGGVLRWIPRFKLPVAVLQQHLDTLRRLGVQFRTGAEVRSAQQLLGQGFDAVFLGIGASHPTAPRIPGAWFDGVLSSTEFLVRVFYEPAAMPNDWRPIANLTGRHVAVLGGGDSAMDCVRSAIRLGATEVTCIYRRDEANMPGSKKEVKAAKDEGARMLFLASPTAFLSEDGWAVSGVECVRMELGSPDASGRRAPVPVEGSAFTVDVDLAVLAFGYEVEPSLVECNDLMPPPKGVVRANALTGATPIEGVFAGGDCVTGPALVSTAARSGIVAAEGALRYFAGEPWNALTSAAPAAAAASAPASNPA